MTSFRKSFILAWILLFTYFKPLANGQWLTHPPSVNPREHGQYSLRDPYRNGNEKNQNLPSLPPSITYPIIPTSDYPGSRYINGGNNFNPSQNSQGEFVNIPYNEQARPHIPNEFPIGGGGSSGVYSNTGAEDHLLRTPYNRYGSSVATSSAFPSNSKSISGDYCFEPLLTCDTTNTVLYCIQGRCTCPTQWTLSPGTLPLNTVWHPELKRCVSVLGSGCHITRFGNAPGFPSRYRKQAFTPSSSQSGGLAASSDLQSQEQPKEFASKILKGLIGIPGGGGGSGPVGNGFVYCQPGVQCVPQHGQQEVGVCSGVKNAFKYYVILIGTIVSYYFRNINV